MFRSSHSPQTPEICENIRTCFRIVVFQRDRSGARDCWKTQLFSGFCSWAPSHILQKTRVFEHSQGPRKTAISGLKYTCLCTSRTAAYAQTCVFSSFSSLRAFSNFSKQSRKHTFLNRVARKVLQNIRVFACVPPCGLTRAIEKAYKHVHLRVLERLRLKMCNTHMFLIRRCAWRSRA